MHVQLRATAVADLEEAVRYYGEEAGPEVALAFVDAFDAATSQLRDHPLIGSLRFSFELEIPELRSWPLPGFPYLLFYVPDQDGVDLWRVLHAQRDIPNHLAD